MTCAVLVPCSVLQNQTKLVLMQLLASTLANVPAVNVLSIQLQISNPLFVLHLYKFHFCVVLLSWCIVHHSCLDTVSPS